ncbi:MAG: c-type cytochrome [Candidatus Hydrogenedentota bacterium]|nr:MAG: c-type cytochrome [Candidatus Hydrogenedentota bacterium]
MAAEISTLGLLRRYIFPAARRIKMRQIRAKTGQRVMLSAAVLAFAVLSYRVLRKETQKGWITYQREFQKLCEEKILAKIEDPEENNNPSSREMWEKQLRELNSTRPHLRQVFLPDANIRDLCTTCHLGVGNPLFTDAPEPFRTHPGKILEQHPVEKFGCTVCHNGQGVGTSTRAAHGLEETWFDPLIPGKYLQSTCIGCHETPYGLEGADRIEAGRSAFAKYGCYGCHSVRGFENPPKFAPPFEGFRDKLSDERWMLSWLRTPGKMRPKTIMPAFKLTDEEISHLTAFVLSLKSERDYPKVDLSTASQEDGERLFTELGCKACHSPKRDEGSLTRRVPNLADAGVKLNADWIFEYLKDPKAYNPDTRMPKPDITEADRRNLTAYLTALKDNSEIVSSESLTTREASIQNGEKLVQLHGCYGCHKLSALEKAPLPAVEVAEVAKKALDELPFGNSPVQRTKWDWIYNKIEKPRIYETEDMPLKMPDYQFDESELEGLTTFYLYNNPFKLPERYMLAATQSQQRGQAGEWIVTESNCRGCHMFEEASKPRIDNFIGLKTYVPPRLVGEGEKVQPQWAFQFLTKPLPMRPWLKMRMPNFSFAYDQVESLIGYFSVMAESHENARVPYVLLPRKEEIPQIEIDMGEYRVRSDKCMQCHPISLEAGLPEDVKLEDLSINLMLAKTRLRSEWIKNFLRDPDKYAGAGTKMPYVFYTPEGVPRVSDAEMWIDYVTNYIMIMEEVPQPLPEEEEPEEEIDWTEMEY